MIVRAAGTSMDGGRSRSPIPPPGELPSVLPQAAGSVLAGPASGGLGAPTFRPLVQSDIPWPASAYDSTVIARSGMTHYWEFGDASGSLADSIGSTTLTGSVSVGQKGLIPDGKTSVNFGGGPSAYVAIPSSVLPASGPWSVSLLFKTASPQSTQYIFSADTSGTCDIKIVSSQLAISINGSSVTLGYNPIINAFQTYSIVIAPPYVVLNGFVVYAPTANTNGPSGAGAIGGPASGSGNYFLGFIEKVAICNRSLTLTEAYADWANASLYQ